MGDCGASGVEMIWHTSGGYGEPNIGGQHGYARSVPAALQRRCNLNPVGRVYYGASTLLCVPNALSQPGGYALGAQAGEAVIRRVATDAGFTRFRRAAETPFNLVYEVRP